VRLPCGGDGNERFTLANSDFVEELLTEAFNLFDGLTQAEAIAANNIGKVRQPVIHNGMETGQGTHANDEFFDGDPGVTVRVNVDDAACCEAFGEKSGDFFKFRLLGEGVITNRIELVWEGEVHDSYYGLINCIW
jgi:hypothetical protein